MVQTTTGIHTPAGIGSDVGFHNTSCAAQVATRRASGRRAFTLMELLIVLGIIAALMALGMVVGRQVVGGSKARVTEQLITSLDQSLDSYVADKGEMPPPFYSLAVNVGGKQNFYDFPAIDARPGGTTFTGIPKGKNWYNQYDATVPSVATYAAILKDSSLAESILKVVPSKFVRTRYLDQWYEGTDNAQATPVDILTVTSDDTKKQVDVTSFDVLDAWGRPLRFVHPGFGGQEFFDGPSGPYFDRDGKMLINADGEKRPQQQTVYVRWGDKTPQLAFRRSYQPFDDSKASAADLVRMTGDADEGLCPTRRPYFYSAGPDGDPGKRADNIYTTLPEFPEETALFDPPPSSSY
ncbi:MAG: type II secretion system protein [Phycisphaerales bacterium]|nr:type II secretion system protein [Phycisphaerales bacterium]